MTNDEFEKYPFWAREMFNIAGTDLLLPLKFINSKDRTITLRLPSSKEVKVEASAIRTSAQFKAQKEQQMSTDQAPTQKGSLISNKTVLMPTSLTAENGAKYLMSGEFSVSDYIECAQCDSGDSSSEGEEYQECEFCDGQGGHHINIAVPWDTIKQIYAKAVKHLGKH